MMQSNKNGNLPNGAARETRSPNRVFIASAVLLAVALLLLVLSILQFRAPVSSASRGFQIPKDEETFFALAGNGLAAASAGQMQLFSSGGKCVAEQDASFFHPACAGSSLVSVYYDIGSSGFWALYPDGTARQADTDGAVVFADVNETGLITVLMDVPGSKGSVMVYDTDLTPLFRWDAGTAFPVSARVSRDEILCVNCFSPAGGALRLFRIDRESEQAELLLPGELILDFGFLSDGGIAAITGSRLIFADQTGTVTAEHSFQGSHLNAFSLSGDFVAVSTATGLSGGSAVLTTLDSQGRIMGSQQAPRNVEALSARNGRVLVLYTGEESTLYSSALEEIISYQPAEDVRQVFLCPGGLAYFAGPTGVTQIDFS